MKLTTFIKSYKIALSQICDKVKDWPRVYFCDVQLMDGGVTPFTFSNSSEMTLGALGITVSVNTFMVEMIPGGLDNIALSKDYMKPETEINEAGRVLIILDEVVKRFRGDEYYPLEDLNLVSFSFNYDRNVAVIDTDKIRIYADGNLILFG